MEASWQVDHVIPLSRGGSNWPTNLVCACGQCNSRKCDKLPWLEWQPKNPLENWHPALDNFLNEKDE
jgi:5-methylcytosine-specific restriction endonuclease McrA